LPYKLPQIIKEPEIEVIKIPAVIPFDIRPVKAS
jgi:hypothetical protein